MIWLVVNLAKSNNREEIQRTELTIIFFFTEISKIFEDVISEIMHNLK